MEKDLSFRTCSPKVYTSSEAHCPVLVSQVSWLLAVILKHATTRAKESQGKEKPAALIVMPALPHTARPHSAEWDGTIPPFYASLTLASSPLAL